MRSPSIDKVVRVESQRTYHKKISVPTSKSRANRMLFLAAITPGEITLTNVPGSSDVMDMIQSLEKVGLQISMNEDTVVVKNSFPDCEKLNTDNPVRVDCGYGGTTTRFLAGLLALGSKTYHLEPEGHMRSRPMQEMIKPLEQLGVQVEMNSQDAWMKITGPITKNLEEIDVDTSRSTQFASAIAMTMSLWGGRVNPVDLKASEDYFKMTIDCIKQVKISNWKIPIDFSSLSYPLALAAIFGEVEVLNYTGRDYLQPDSIFIDILKEMGAKVIETESSLKVIKAHSLSAWSGNCSGFPDLVPTLCFVNSFSKNPGTLTHLEVLKHKECDRLEEMKKILTLFERPNNVAKDSISTEYTEAMATFKHYEAPDDHRMIMVAALFMKALAGGEISNWQHIRKSYPYFFEDLANE